MIFSLSEKLQDSLRTLNPEQLKAVEIIDRPGLILSGAGSGKTKVITTRIAYLLEAHRIPPEEILALTFTNKAAQEMKQRTLKLTEKKTSALFIGTFHSLCLEILKEYAELLGYLKNFFICDQSDQQKILKEIFEEENLARVFLMKPSELGYVIGNAKRRLRTPQYFFDQKSNARSQMIGIVFKRYNERLKNQNMMDFDDLLNHTCELLTDYKTEVTPLLKKYRYILVDEYQDTSQVQYEIIRKLSAGSKNIFLVGDDDQSIYSWRGADIRNILRFQEEYPDSEIVRLERNYRSVPGILQAANAVISNNSQRMEKRLRTEGVQGDLIYYLHAEDEAEEMEYLVLKLRQLKNKKNFRYSDFAFLYRTNYHSRTIEESLRNEGIPYQLVGGTKFFDREEIKNALAYLRLVANPGDEISFFRIVNYPRRGIGEQTLKKLTRHKKNDRSFLDRIAEQDFSREVGSGQYGALLAFRNIILEARESLKNRPFAEIFKDLFEQLKIENEIFRSEKQKLTAKNKIRNLQEFINTLFLYQKKSTSLSDFLRYVTLFSKESEASQDRVQLMTVHSAKGLEFECVILCGLGDEDFPNARAVEEKAVEEERRLFYVAITRAKQNLILTHSKQKMQYGKTRYVVPSRFLDEIPPQLLSTKKRNGTLTAEERSTAGQKRNEILQRLFSKKES